MVDLPKIKTLWHFEILPKPFKSDILLSLLHFRIGLFQIVIKCKRQYLPKSDLLVNEVEPYCLLIDEFAALRVDEDVLDVLLSFDDTVLADVEHLEDLVEEGLVLFEVVCV